MSGCSPIGGAQACAESVASGAVAAMAQAFADSAGYAMKSVMTLWIGLPSASVTGADSVSTWVNDRVVFLVFGVAFISVLVAAFRMARTGEFEHLGDLGVSLGKLVVVTGAAATVVSMGLEIGDLFAPWILAQADFEPSALALLTVPALTGPAGTQVIVLLLSAVVILTQLVQAVLMLAKSAVCVLLVGFLPLSAGATNTTVGSQAFIRALGWLAAWVLYKPVAALIYAAAFKLASKDQGLAGQLSGIALMVLAVVALPALMKLAVPVVAQAASGSAGAISTAAVGAGVATGAVLAAGMTVGPLASFAPAGAGAGAGPSGAMPLGAMPPLPLPPTPPPTDTNPIEGTPS